MDSVALASVIVTGAIGLAGIGLAAVNGSRERESRHREADAARRHELKLALDQRLFESRRELYGDVAKYVLATQGLCVFHRPSNVVPARTQPWYEDPNDTTVVNLFLALQPRMATYASDAANTALAVYQRAFMEYREKTWQCQRILWSDYENAEPLGAREVCGRAEELYEEVVHEEARLRATLRADLAGEEPPADTD